MDNAPGYYAMCLVLTVAALEIYLKGAALRG